MWGGGSSSDPSTAALGQWHSADLPPLAPPSPVGSFLVQTLGTCLLQSLSYSSFRICPAPMLTLVTAASPSEQVVRRMLRTHSTGLKTSRGVSMEMRGLSGNKRSCNFGLRLPSEQLCTIQHQWFPHKNGEFCNLSDLLSV